MNNPLILIGGDVAKSAVYSIVEIHDNIDEFGFFLIR